jgi:hypothetical protein
LDENHKLEPQPLDESLRPKSGKSRLNIHGTILKGKSGKSRLNIHGTILKGKSGKSRLNIHGTILKGKSGKSRLNIHGTILKGKSGKSRLNIHGTILKGKINQFGPKKNGAKRERAHDLKNQDASQSPNLGLTQGFNLLQMSPNWFLGIWTHRKTHLKWVLIRASLTLKTPTLLSFFDLGSCAL